MSPRPAPDLTARRDRVLDDARRIAEAEGWEAVTIRRLATELGLTQPVLYTAFGIHGLTAALLVVVGAVLAASA